MSKSFPDELKNLPYKDVYLRPAAAFQAMAQDPPVKGALALYVLVTFISELCVYRLDSNLRSLMAALAPKLPWLLPSVGPPVLNTALGLAGISFLAGVITGIMRLIGNRRSFRAIWAPMLLAAAAVAPFGAITHAIPLIRSVVTVWKWLLYGIAVKTVFGTSLAKTVGAMAASYLALVLAAALPSTMLLSTIYPARNLRSPASLSSSGVNANYDWTANALDGTPLPFSQTKGKVVLLNFWATWCYACRIEMPSLQRLYDRVKNDHIVFMLVSDETPGIIRSYVEKNRYSLPFYSLPKGWPLGFEAEGLPTTFIISPDGKIVDRRVGASEWDSEDTIQFLKSLASKKPAS